MTIQCQQYQVRSVFFYNVENLFDTIDDPATFDDRRTPGGRYNWNSRRYALKLNRLAEVISSFGQRGHSAGPDLLGVCEIENASVLQDLVLHPRLRDMGYGIIHRDSPDERGMDVAFLYRKSAFIPVTYRNHRLEYSGPALTPQHTRDQLVVHGYLDGEEIYFVVNHWPSRRGGQIRSEPFRIAAARLTLVIIDSIVDRSTDPRIIIMGDFNDDPTDRSIALIVNSKYASDTTASNKFFNPMDSLFHFGRGTLGYRDKWSLFDQFILSENLKPEQQSGYRFGAAGIYAPQFLIQKRGRFRGYPLRTYAGGRYQGGYSDHFPVYLWLLRKVN